VPDQIFEHPRLVAIYDVTICLVEWRGLVEWCGIRPVVRYNAPLAR